MWGRLRRDAPVSPQSTVMRHPPPIVYRGRALGAYGFAEKPWFLPDVRLEAFTSAMERRGLGRPRVSPADPPTIAAQ